MLTFAAFPPSTLIVDRALCPGDPSIPVGSSPELENAHRLATRGNPRLLFLDGDSARALGMRGSWSEKRRSCGRREHG